MADIISLAEYKVWSRDSDATKDAQRTVLIAQSSAMADAYCQTQLMTAARIDEIFTDHVVAVQLQARPITAITEIKVDPYNATGTYLIDPTDVFYRASGSLMFKPTSTYYPRWPDALIRFSYTGGYTTAPNDLKLAAMLIVSTLEDMASIADRHATMERVRDVTMKYAAVTLDIASDLFIGARELLNQYRNPLIV